MGKRITRVEYSHKFFENISGALQIQNSEPTDDEAVLIALGGDDIRAAREQFDVEVTRFKHVYRPKPYAGFEGP